MTYLLFVLYSAIFGAIIGSFLHVVSLRFHTGKSLKGRSHCLSCGTQLKWYELIPLVSWLIQKGRCRTCHAKIPFDVFFIELFSAFLFFILSSRSYLFFGDTTLSIQYVISTIYLFLIASLFLIIFFYDLKHKIIPDELSFFLAMITFIGMFFFRFDNNLYTFVGFHVPSISNILAGILIPLPFALIWFFSRGKMMGLGDPKLMVSIGFLLGMRYGWSAIFLAFWIGLFVSLLFILMRRMKNKHLLLSHWNAILKEEIPFAPYLILATIITLVSSISVLPSM